jgi:dihydrofolate reductase
VSGDFVGRLWLAGLVAKTQYYTATSIDGFIAGPGNWMDWLLAAGQGTDAEGRFSAFFSGVGAMVMGATTYEWSVREGGLDQPGAWQKYYGQTPCWVFSHRQLAPVPGADITFTQADVREVHAQLSAAAGGQNIWLVGGGALAAQFADYGLLDEIILSVAPVLLGGGTPLLPRRLLASDLTLAEAEPDSNFVFLTYRVGGGGKRPGDADLSRTDQRRARSPGDQPLSVSHRQASAGHK